MTKFLPFVYDREGFYTNQKCFIITGNNLKLLTAIFNSKVAAKWIQDNCAELGRAGWELSKVFFENFPAPFPTDANKSLIKDISHLACQVIAGKEQHTDTTALEAEIDRLVYDLYGLSQEEIKLVEDTRMN